MNIRKRILNQEVKKISSFCIITCGLSFSAILISDPSKVSVLPVYAGTECINNNNCGARKIVTSQQYYGIQGTLVLPQNLKVPNDYSYVAFYLGFDNTCEGGVSYRLGSWRRFLNCGASGNWSEPIGSNLPPKIDIKLVNNGDGSASLYIGHTLAKTIQASLGAATTVKAVHSTYNPSGAVQLNSYVNASFINLQIKTSPGKSGLYSPLPARRIIPEYPRSYMMEKSINGLATSL
ncbi:MAG: hypothetical protein ACL9RN_04335 [Cylindrospermopsis raciborskii]|jgi:hypothetical protein|uniref:hypothetical protein n=1 Tax=Cylindrospermopsis raciborskii TaxID=77022 RepID=UPI003D0CFC1A